MKRALLIGFTLLMNFFLVESLAAKEPKESWSVFSPDKNVRLSIESQQGSLSYYVLLQGDTVVRHSALGIITDANDFSTGLTYQSESPKKIDEAYTMLIGKRKENRNEANELTISFLNSTKNKIQYSFRVYNDGVAFRYQFLNVKKPVTVTREVSSFSIPTNGEAWLQSYGWSPAYENWYTFGSKIAENAKDSSGWSFPSLFHSGNNWLLLTEAGLDEHFYASHLQQDCSGGVYKIRQ
ncbi:MAG TPA: glycoside hydrolase family 97 N-terminal domain-containing protein, partial [Flavisolibacter sp.]|nr:glycoside hydrolase family 97 N-terminal domain-containing protein [Flavisolibacter sp.]